MSGGGGGVMKRCTLFVASSSDAISGIPCTNLALILEDFLLSVEEMHPIIIAAAGIAVTPDITKKFSESGVIEHVQYE